MDEEYRFLSGKLFENSHEGIMVTTTSGEIKLVNPAFCRITGYTMEEVLWQHLRILKSWKHDNTFYANMWEALLKDGIWKGEIWNKRKNGELYVQWTTWSIIKNDQGSPLCYAAVFTDITESKKMERKFQEELDLARRVQLSVLPSPLIDKGIQIHGYYIPSQMVGGDMYAWYQIDQYRYGVILLDVMGHGIASSLVGMSLRSLLRGLISKVVDPIGVLTELDYHLKYLFQNEDSSIPFYVSVIYALIDQEGKTIEYVNAGSPPGILMMNGHHPQFLESSGPPVGMLPELLVESNKISLNTPAKLILYSDGLIERIGEPISLGIGKLANAAQKYDQEENPRFLQLLVNHYRPEDGFIDDVCLVAVNINR